MIVKELIDELQKLPKNARVWILNEICEVDYSISVELDTDNEVMITSE